LLLKTDVQYRGQTLLAGTYCATTAIPAQIVRSLIATGAILERNLAVLIDFENIAAGAEREKLGRVNIELIMNRLKEKGRIIVARSYADWGRFAKYKQQLLREGVNLFELPSHGMGDKNRADVALVVDCMELAYTKPYVDTFVIVSGDSDFTPLITKIKELNKRAIGCGTRGGTSRLIVESCDEFFYYNSLVEERSRQKPTSRRRPVQAPAQAASGTDTVDNAEENAQMSTEGAKALVLETLNGLQRDKPQPIHASVLKEAMLRKEPAFSEGDFGFRTFAQYLQSLQKQGDLHMERDRKAGGYRVDQPGSEVEAPVIPANAGIEFGFDGRTQELYQLLKDDGMEPLDATVRGAVIRAFVENVSNRESRNKKATVQWVAQDVSKNVRSDHPEMTNRQARAVLRGLQQTGLLLHSDGDPIRSSIAPFNLGDANEDELGRALELEYLKQLAGHGVDLEKEMEAIGNLLLSEEEGGNYLEAMLPMVTQPEDQPTAQE
jgi:uncharacterized protein (TIGR00288 family)